ncbi:unnamed protein product, partial [marine sediment metagenome]
QPLHIEVNLGDQYLRKIIRLEEFDLPFSFDESACRDDSGKICGNDVPVRVCGSKIYGDMEYVSYPALVPTHLGDKIIFLGDKLGQIAKWPHESVPSSWHPVWAIVLRSRKQWDVIFCGTSKQLKESYFPVKPVGDRLCVKRWKEALWVRRKRINPPEIKVVRKIWQEYVRAARNV